MQAQWHRLLTFSTLRVLELVLQGKRNGHRDFCPSAGIHENDTSHSIGSGFLLAAFVMSSNNREISGTPSMDYLPIAWVT